MQEKMSSSKVLTALAVLLFSASTALAADNWVGSWTLDVAKSSATPGPLPRSRTLKFEPSKGGVKLTSDTVDAQGKKQHASYEAKFDGTETPWKGNPDADTSMPKRVDDNSYVNTWKKAGKVTITATVTVSEDAKTLTIVQTGTNAKGEPVNSTHVYARQ